jgi:hypothetical protein
MGYYLKQIRYRRSHWFSTSFVILRLSLLEGNQVFFNRFTGRSYAIWSEWD